MSKPLMDIVLPRLARPLYRQLERYRTGELNDRQFTRRFEALLQRQHVWLAKRGISAVGAAGGIQAAVLGLSLPGLRAEAAEGNIPLEVVEHRAVREAAADVSRSYDIEERKVTELISTLVARHGE